MNYEFAAVADIDALWTPIENAVIERKYDGWGVMVVFQDLDVKVFTRSGREVVKPSWLPYLAHEYETELTVIHCEMVSGDDSTPGKVNAVCHPVQLVILDVLIRDGMDLRDDPYILRKLHGSEIWLALQMVHGYVNGSIQLPESHTVDVFDPSDVPQLKERSKQLGYEGFVVKDPEALYSDGLLGYRVKAVDTLDGIVKETRCRPGLPNRIRSLGVALQEGGDVVAWVPPPPGEHCVHDMIGKVVEFTHIGYGAIPMRNCQFIRWREDKTAEMCRPNTKMVQCGYTAEKMQAVLDMGQALDLDISENRGHYTYPDEISKEYPTH